jgi:hypothetical protein
MALRGPDKSHDNGNYANGGDDGDEADDIDRGASRGWGARGGGHNPNCRQAPEPEALVFDTDPSLLHRAEPPPFLAPCLRLPAAAAGLQPRAGAAGWRCRQHGAACAAACACEGLASVADTTSLWGSPLAAAGLLPGLARHRSRTGAQPASRRSVRRRGRPAGSAAARSASLQRGRAGRRPARSAAWLPAGLSMLDVPRRPHHRTSQPATHFHHPQSDVLPPCHRHYISPIWPRGTETGTPPRPA